MRKMTEESLKAAFAGESQAHLVKSREKFKTFNRRGLDKKRIKGILIW